MSEEINTNPVPRIGDRGWIRRYSVSYDVTIKRSWTPDLGGNTQILVESTYPEVAKNMGMYFFGWVELSEWEGFSE